MADFQRFVDKYSLTFPQIDDAAGALFDAYNIPATPGLVVVDTDGSMEGRIGAADPKDIAQLLADAVG